MQHAIESPLAAVTNGEVRRDRVRLRDGQLAIGVLREDEQLDVAQGSVPRAPMRASSRCRMRKIREQTVPTVEFLSRAMSL